MKFRNTELTPERILEGEDCLLPKDEGSFPKRSLSLALFLIIFYSNCSIEMLSYAPRRSLRRVFSARVNLPLYR